MQSPGEWTEVIEINVLPFSICSEKVKTEHSIARTRISLPMVSRSGSRIVWAELNFLAASLPCPDKICHKNAKNHEFVYSLAAPFSTTSWLWIMLKSSWNFEILARNLFRIDSQIFRPTITFRSTFIVAKRRFARENISFWEDLVCRTYSLFMSWLWMPK
jgi:hypothetical protein